MVGIADGRARFVNHLWVGAALMVGLSALSYLAMRLTAGLPVGWVLDEVHQNLSVAIDLALPTWYASMLWALLGLFAWLHGAADHPRRWSWRLMALIAWYASVDEYLMLHERLNGPAARIERMLGIDLGGATWVLLGGAVAILVATLLWRLVSSWPAKARRLVLAGGAVFVGGAIGFELVHNLIERDMGLGAPPAVFAYHVEEALEKAGVILAIAGLLEFLPVTPAPTWGRRAPSPESEAVR